MLPNFIVIGAAKCATTTLCHLLGQHPEVFMCDPKEPWFFSHYYHDQGMARYEQYFQNATGKRAVGEGSTTYTKLPLFPRTAQRIAQHLPSAKLLYVVRHPLRQIESNWLQMRKCSEMGVGHDFARSVREMPVLVGTAHYLRQLRAYREFFPPQQIRVMLYEDFQRDPGAFVRDCFHYLEVEPTFVPPDLDQKLNATVGDRVDRPIVSELRRHRTFYALRDLAPKPVIDLAKRLLKKPITDKPRWDEPTRRWVLEQLQPDSVSLLRELGRAEDFWDFSTSRETAS